VTSYIIQQLVEVQANAKLLLNVDWYIMPVMNPDGIVYFHKPYVFIVKSDLT
jgi:murein tripeptide amidase MpaA